MAETDVFLHISRHAGHLKDIPRTGWMVRGVEDPESVADHSYRVALLCLVHAQGADLDPHHCVSLALVHDLHESVSGDIIPVEGIEGGMGPEEKYRREMDAGSSMWGECGLEGSRLEALWKEHMDQRSPESRFVHDMDRIEMALTALEYRKGNRSPRDDLQEFLDAAWEELKTSPGRKVYQRLVGQPRSGKESGV